MISSWVCLCFLAVICLNFIYPAFSSSSTTVSYTKHCSSIVPESSTTVLANQHSVPYLSTTYFTGGDRILARKSGNQTYAYTKKSFRLRIQPDYYETISPGVYNVEGVLLIRSPYSLYDDRPRNDSYGGAYYRRSRSRGLIRFSLTGFWSEVSKKLCMVGSASYNDAGSKIINLDAVLKLNYANENNPNIYTGVISGGLASTSSANDPSYFDPILIFSFPAVSIYNYSLVSKEVVAEISSDFDVPKVESLGLEPDKFCSAIAWRATVLELEYSTECRGHRNCSPLGGGVGLIGQSPRFLYLTPVECSEAERKLRYMATFQNFGYDDQSFSLDSTVIGEASWDGKNNRLIGVACRLLDPLGHFGNAVGDCTMRLSLRYPSILTIRNDSKIVAQIWSSKAVNESGYFRKIDLTSWDENDVVDFPGLKYEYTELDRVRKSCPKKPAKKENTYPDGHSYDMRFDMSIKNDKGEQVAWGYAAPIFVGDDLYQGTSIMAMGPASAIAVEAISKPVNSNNTSPTNISYKISINPFYQSNSSNWLPSLNWSVNLHNQVEISAEGVYSPETGNLCMVGCRKLVKDSTISRDCEIIVKFQFASFNERGGLIKGTIESTRAEMDSLHFDNLIMQSNAYYVEEAEQSIWRMDLEIAMVLISNTLACIFVGMQIFHVKRNPEVPCFISIVMLLILSVGHMIPLVLNFEAVFLENHNKQALFLSNGGRLEANEVAVRVVTMVAFLLTIRLFQLVWTAKQSDGNEKISWNGEKKAGFVSLALYILGGLLTLLLNRTRNRYARSVYRKYSVWGDLRSYAGLILDGFLLPQILLNIFIGSAEKALSRPFYFGTSAVRLVPHAYNQYRKHNYPQFDLNSTYYYANPAADFYSTAWDIIIPCGVVALAVIVFMQQRHGGRCILPQRLRGLEMYEKVPTVDNE